METRVDIRRLYILPRFMSYPVVFTSLCRCIPNSAPPSYCLSFKKKKKRIRHSKWKEKVLKACYSFISFFLFSLPVYCCWTTLDPSCVSCPLLLSRDFWNHNIWILFLFFRIKIETSWKKYEIFISHFFLFRLLVCPGTIEKTCLLLWSWRKQEEENAINFFLSFFFVLGIEFSRHICWLWTGKNKNVVFFRRRKGPRLVCTNSIDSGLLLLCVCVWRLALWSKRREQKKRGER